MRFLSATFLFIISLIGSWAATAETRPVVKVGYYEFPPVSYTDKTGQAQGSSVDLCRTLLTNQGYDVVFKGLPSARLYAQLISGEIDLWFGSVGKLALQAHILESSMLISEITMALFYHPDAPEPQLPRDLQDKKIILINGYSYAEPVTEWLANRSLNLQLSHANQHTSATAMLMRKRGDYLINYLLPMSNAQQTLGIDGLEFPHVNIRNIPLSFVVSKKSAFAEHLLDDLESAYAIHKTTLQDSADR